MPAKAPTMAGFEWTHRNVLPPRPPLGDLWCLQDAVCELFCWPPGSAEWFRFVEAPEPHDVGRLFQHLVLQGMTLSIGRMHSNWLPSSTIRASPSTSSIRSRWNMLFSRGTFGTFVAFPRSTCD